MLEEVGDHNETHVNAIFSLGVFDAMAELIYYFPAVLFSDGEVVAFEFDTQVAGGAREGIDGSLSIHSLR